MLPTLKKLINQQRDIACNVGKQYSITQSCDARQRLLGILQAITLLAPESESHQYASDAFETLIEYEKSKS